MLETQNLKLKKPGDNDILDPSLSINPNMDIIDTEIGKIKEDIKNISSDAAGTSYDNTNSKLTSTNVQGAIDELNTKTTDNKTSISEVEKIANSAKNRGDEVKQILVDKLISRHIIASTSEDFESLINKISSIQPITQIGTDVILFKKDSMSTSATEFEKVLEFDIFTFGDFKLITTLAYNGSYGLSTANIKHISSSGSVKWENNFENNSGNGIINIEIDILNTIIGDKIIFNLKGFSNKVGAKLTNTSITCGKVFK